MACLIKAPDGIGKGCVSFTTPERDQLIFTDAALRAAVERLKERYVVGLHHNWHDHAFSYDPLFDFSMAGAGDLIERDSQDFPQVPIDACNFAPPWFVPDVRQEPFWDILNVARAVDFKGIPQFLEAIRKLYDRGSQLRVLFLCATKDSEKLTGIPDLRRYFEAMFSPTERFRFTLMTMDWDYPFPLDLETLGVFYRSSRIFVHAAPDERRCRTAGYAWASGKPVVARKNVASILPPELRKPPYYFGYDNYSAFADAIEAAIRHDLKGQEWGSVSAEFQAGASAGRFDAFLVDWAASRPGMNISRAPINPLGLDIRLGRHHGLSTGANRINQSIEKLVDLLSRASHQDILSYSLESDPERWLETL